MSEIDELRQAIEALTARFVILETLIASSMEGSEQEIDPLESYHRTVLQRRKDQ